MSEGQPMSKVVDGARLFGRLAGRQFGLESTRVSESDRVTHLSYRIIN